MNFDYNYEEQKKKFIDHMTFLKGQSVEESVFKKKYEEITDDALNGRHLNNMGSVIEKIWKPTDIYNEAQTINEIEALKPEIIFIEDQTKEDKKQKIQNHPELVEDWLILRKYCHTMDFDQTPGRFLRFLVVNKSDEDITKPFQYLGVVSIASDVICISDRDNYIGWTSENRLKQGKLVNSAIGSCIMSTQPFGYNFLGGKFVASLLTTKSVRDVWEKKYNNKLVGFTTTSLYGTNSMYNGIPYWHKCGASSGKISIKPDDGVNMDSGLYTFWHDWIKKNRTEEYTKKMTQAEGVSGPVTGAKQRGIQMIFNELGLASKDFTHGYERGVYYAGVYENFKEFFQGKIDETQLIIKPKFATDVAGVIDWWKPKAIKRYQNLLKEGRLKTDILFYNGMRTMSYEEAKEKYFGEVGR
jgi:hypothetical protein